MLQHATKCDECDGSGRYFIDGVPQACICSESQDEPTYKILDGSDSDVLGGAVKLSNALLLTGVPVQGEPMFRSLEIGQESVARFHLSGSGVYRVVRVS